MTVFNPKFTITNRMTAAITQIKRARGFLEAARSSDYWVRDMVLIKEAHLTTHIEGTQLTLDQAEHLWKGEARLPKLILMMRGNCSIIVPPLNSLPFPTGKSLIIKKLLWAGFIRIMAVTKLLVKI